MPYDARRIDEVIAVRGEGLTGLDDRPLEESRRLAAQQEELESFRRAGWRFLDEDTALQARGPGAQTARVYLAGNHRVLLFDGTLNVKFRDNTSRDIVQERLQQVGFGIRKRLPMGMNTFSVKPLSGDVRDVREAVHSLESIDEVEFAEPEFIEHLGGR